MCGRFALSAPVDQIRNHFGLQEEVILAPRYNIAPSQPVAAIREGEAGESELIMMQWGLIPSWARDRNIGRRMINARAETLEEKPSFKTSFRKYRCLIPADGFYEWKKVEGAKAKQPYFIHLSREKLFAFAGVWSSWTDRSSRETVVSCAIITTNSNALMAEIHDRMPVIVAPSWYNVWLDQKSHPDQLKTILVPYNASLMEYYPVSKLCNSPGIDTPECINRVGFG